LKTETEGEKQKKRNPPEEMVRLQPLIAPSIGSGSGKCLFSMVS